MGQKTRTSWKKGQSGNPKGRPKGSRDAINEQFLRDAASAWGKQGIAALEAMGEKDPSAFCRMFAALLPKDTNLNVKNDLGDAFLKYLENAPDPVEKEEIDRLRAENERLRSEAQTACQETVGPRIH